MSTIIDIHAREILALRARLNELYAQHTGVDIDDNHGAHEPGGTARVSRVMKQKQQRRRVCVIPGTCGGTVTQRSGGHKWRMKMKSFRWKSRGCKREKRSCWNSSRKEDERTILAFYLVFYQTFKFFWRCKDISTDFSKWETFSMQKSDRPRREKWHKSQWFQTEWFSFPCEDCEWQSSLLTFSTFADESWWQHLPLSTYQQYDKWLSGFLILRAIRGFILDRSSARSPQ